MKKILAVCLLLLAPSIARADSTGVQFSSGESATFNGISYVGGSSALALAGAGDVRVLFTNTSSPGTLGRMCYVTAIDGYASVLGYAKFYVNPTVGIPTTPGVVSNRMLATTPNPSACALAMDSSLVTPLSGGTQLANTIVLPTGALAQCGGTTASTLYAVPPGQVLGIDIHFAALLSTLSFNLYWKDCAATALC